MSCIVDPEEVEDAMEKMGLMWRDVVEECLGKTVAEEP